MKLQKEHEASLVAILLHDVGHGPFSHALENSIVNNLKHEKISLMYMYKLNDIFENYQLLLKYLLKNIKNF